MYASDWLSKAFWLWSENIINYETNDHPRLIIVCDLSCVIISCASEIRQQESWTCDECPDLGRWWITSWQVCTSYRITSYCCLVHSVYITSPITSMLCNVSPNPGIFPKLVSQFFCQFRKCVDFVLNGYFKYN